MGNSTQTIHYSCNSKYVGQVSNNLPHGNGILYIHKNSPAFNNKLDINNEEFTTVDATFENGSLKKFTINLKNQLKYSGQLNQKSSFDGQGNLIDADNVQYQGDFQKGRLVKGKIDSSKATGQNHVAYICETNGQFIGTSIINGPSTFYNITDKYFASGQFHKGKLSKGFFIFQNGDTYEGEFSQGCPNGQGTYKSGKFTTPDASAQPSQILQNYLAKEFVKALNLTQKNQTKLSFCLTVHFEAGNPNGKGELLFSNGDHYKGRFKDGQMHGHGQYTFGDGTIYKGSFYCGSMHGDCTMQFNEKSKINENKKKHQILQKYEGEVSDGLFHGLGVLHYANGVIFKGYFMNGAKNGPGVLIYCQSKYKCLYVMNKLVGQLKQIKEK